MNSPYLCYDRTLSLLHCPKFGQWLYSLLFLSIEKALSSAKGWIGLMLSVALLAVTHLPSLLLGSFCSTLYLFYQAFPSISEPLRALAIFTLSALLGLGVVAIYFVPMLIEQSFLRTDFMKQVSGGWKENFLGGRALTTNFFITDIAKLSGFTLGLTLLIATQLKPKQQSDQSSNKDIFFWSGFCLLLFVLISPFSIFLWSSCWALQMIQFPWRALGLIAFSLAALYALVTQRLQKNVARSRPIKILCMLLLLLSLSNNLVSEYLITKFRSGLNNPGPHMDDGLSEHEYARLLTFPRCCMAPWDISIRPNMVLYC